MTAGGLACLIFGLAVAVSGCGTPGARAPQGPALWRVNDVDTTVYLFGTIHLAPPNADWRTPAINAAFNSADELVIETIVPEDPAALNELIAPRGLNPPGVSLRDALPADDRAALEDGLSRLNLPPDSLDAMRPWLAGLTLAVMAFQAAGFDPDSGIDKTLERAARLRGLAVTPLETPAEQFDIFANLAPEEELALLRDTLNDLDTVDVYAARFFTAWSTGDSAKLARLMNQSLDRHPRMRAVVLDERNARWAAWIDGRMARPGVVFVAVGAGHLGGRNSVQDYLAARGLKAVRVLP